MENSGVVEIGASSGTRTEQGRIPAHEYSLRDLFNAIIEKFESVESDVDDLKAEMDQIDFVHLRRLMDLDALELEQMINQVDDLDPDNLASAADVEEANDSANEALSKIEDLEIALSNLSEKVEKVEEQDDLKYMVEGFKEEVESISQRQDLMDKRLCRIERVFNVVRQAVSNDPTE